MDVQPTFTTLRDIAAFIKMRDANSIPSTIMRVLSEQDLLIENERQLYELMINEHCPSHLALDCLLTPEFFATYRAKRELGLQPLDCGRFAGVTPIKMTKILRGDCVTSVELYEKLCQVELIAPLYMQDSALTTLRTAMADGDWRAAQFYLERTQRAWREKTHAVVENRVRVSTEKRARMGLEALRAARERTAHIHAARAAAGRPQ